MKLINYKSVVKSFYLIIDYSHEFFGSILDKLLFNFIVSLAKGTKPRPILQDLMHAEQKLT